MYGGFDMAQELGWMLECFVGIGACAIMFFFMLLFVGIIIYTGCYLFWLGHLYMMIRKRYKEERWWREYLRDVEELEDDWELEDE